ncbi:MAG: Hsp20/alpha crystallin family protein [Chloroflexota bacterium]|nr:Hsp20/alpha crystallin family protein [Chloroflexota bacterium]MDE2946074.1 Hsp20/alpha crystallin family protein [Chloroflexota bacterium]
MMIRTRNPYFRLVDDLLNDARPWLTGGESEARGFGPAVDVEENADAYIVQANLPGINQDSISVNIHEDVLTISAETAAENRDETSKMLIRERRFGKFSRSLRFPTIVDGDAVEAGFENGVLSITLPKASQVKPRQIPVKVIAAGN